VDAGSTLWGRLSAHPLVRSTREFFELPPWEGARLTPRRLLNLYRVRWEHRTGRTRLRSHPVKLTVEATNVCNLECPGCYTGIGDIGRARGHLSLPLWRQLLAELGDYLFEVEFYNWGEPLLGRHIYTMVEEAHARGISTTVSTNFSLPFDAERAERLVRTGLTVLGVSIDGARQETYERYRVGGDLAKVLRNCALVADAKRRLGSPTPRLVWEYHVFEHNADDVPRARELARELGMELAVSKGWTIGEEWDRGGEWDFFDRPHAVRCPFLWGFAVVNNDGGVAPCCGTFFGDDDMGRVDERARFHDVWNSERFRTARGLFRAREGDAAARRLACFECPNTRNWERWKAHRAGGGTEATYRPDFTMNDVVNYFWSRRPERSSGRAAG
jgi:MoaA/NifB/PqqE/SkfB family radical SAM enzyme